MRTAPVRQSTPGLLLSTSEKFLPVVHEIREKVLGILELFLRDSLYLGDQVVLGAVFLQLGNDLILGRRKVDPFDILLQVTEISSVASIAKRVLDLVEHEIPPCCVR